MGLFAKKVLHTQKPQTQLLQSQKTNVNQIDKTTTKSDGEESVNYVTSYQQLHDQVYDSNYDSNSDDYVAAISKDAANQLKQFNAKIQYRKIFASSMIDSGSVFNTVKKEQL